MKSNRDGLMIDEIVAYIDRDNIDTDQIIPTEYLKSIKKFGFAKPNFLIDFRYSVGMIWSVSILSRSI